MSRPVAISWAFVDHRFPLSSTDQRYQSSGRRSTAVCWDCYPSAASTLGLAWVPRWDHHHSTASFNDRTSMVVCQVSKGTCRKDQKSMFFFPIYLDQLLDPGLLSSSAQFATHGRLAMSTSWQRSAQSSGCQDVRGSSAESVVESRLEQSGLWLNLVEAHLSQHIDTLLKDLSTWTGMTKNADGSRTAVIIDLITIYWHIWHSILQGAFLGFGGGRLCIICMWSITSSRWSRWSGVVPLASSLAHEVASSTAAAQASSQVGAWIPDESITPAGSSTGSPFSLSTLSANARWTSKPAKTHLKPSKRGPRSNSG